MNQTITALKVQKRNPNRVNVYLDNEFAFGLARIVAAWLHVGQELDEAKIASLQKEDQAEVAYQKALHFLSFRPRSEKEVEQRLLKEDYTENVISATIDRLKEQHFLSDPQFAALWVENRTAFRPRSQRMLAMELRQKGIAEEVISSALEQTDEDEVLAYQAAQRYVRRLKGLEWQVFRQRLTGYLGRRGFHYGTAAPVVRRIWAEFHSEDGDHLFDDDKEDLDDKD